VSVLLRFDLRFDATRRRADRASPTSVDLRRVQGWDGYDPTRLSSFYRDLEGDFLVSSSRGVDASSIEVDPDPTFDLGFSSEYRGEWALVSVSFLFFHLSRGKPWSHLIVPSVSSSSQRWLQLCESFNFEIDDRLGLH